MENDWNPYERHACHDCDALEGEIHEIGCDVEQCPICGEQAICCYEHCFYPDGDPRPLLLDDSRRLPFMMFPGICVRCGELWPDTYMVSDKDWEKVVPPTERDGMLCWDCYSFLAGLVGVEPILRRGLVQLAE